MAYTPLSDVLIALNSIYTALDRYNTYSTSFTVTLAATPTDFFEIKGSGSTIVEITAIYISGVQTVAALNVINLIKRSTASSGGTSTNATLVPHRNTNTAATATCKIFTANPTVGTAVGNIRTLRIPIPTATATTNDIIPIVFRNGQNQGIILNTTSQTLCGNFGGATITGGIIDVTIEWIEHN